MERVQIKANSIVTYHVPKERGKGKNISCIISEDEEARPYRGEMKGGAKKAIMRICVSWAMLLHYQFENVPNDLSEKLYFVTLTLPSDLPYTDKELYRKTLNSFITSYKYKYSDLLYIWKAEKQVKGKTHYHLVINKELDSNILRKDWNKILSNCGFIEKYREDRRLQHKGGFKYDEALGEKHNYEAQLGWWKYGVSTNWSNPRTVHIEVIGEINKVGHYIAKYVGKNEDKGTISGKVWGCSDKLKSLNYCTFDLKMEICGNIDNVKQLGKSVKNLNEWVEIVDFEDIISSINADKKVKGIVKRWAKREYKILKLNN